MDIQSKKGGNDVELTARITEVQRFSVHDGPGIRTTVFFKGCPLRCAWCHNPECISGEEQELFYPEKCIGCGKCAEGCFSGARVRCGEQIGLSALLARITADRPYYGEAGGVTFSGGEPLMQAEFLCEILQACRAEGIRTAVESSMIYWDRSVFDRVDYLMVDIKVFDPVRHRQYTGVENGQILEHLRRADEVGMPICIRTPIVPGVNDTAEEIAAIAAFVRSLRHAVAYELLPYHPLGLVKARALGRPQTEFCVPTQEKMEELRRYADIR